MRLLLLVIAYVVVGATAYAADIRSSVKASDLPAAKQTTLGLYLTPADAAAALDAEPGILFVDVRDPIEVSFVGHPAPVDAIVPFKIVKMEFDEKKGAYKEAPNPDFVKNVEAITARDGFGKNHPIIVICRSGNRSASAANALAEAGYTNVWNLVEGFEGDKDKAGMRTVNGWRNAGLPWTYKLTADQAWVPSK